MQHDSAMAEAALAYVMETAPVLALRLDAQQRVVTANTHAQRILGSDVVGRTLAELVVDFTNMPEASCEGVQLLSLNTAARVPESYYFRRFALPDGALALGSLDSPEQERLRAELLGLNRELNDLTRQLHLANAELREMNQLKNQFLGMAAHDLRKPVGVIMTYVEFVLDEAKQLSSEQREFLRTCLATASGMKRLIDNFLDVSIIESRNLRLDLAPATVREILAGVEPIARLMAGKKKITLLVNSPGDAQRLTADAVKLQQVLLNLIGNAVEHSVPGQRVWVSSHWDDQILVIAVCDEGPGIAPEDQGRLFKAFERAGTRKTAGERSVGLGLAIARLIVEAHGGRIWVESTPGLGSTFSVALPVQTPQQQQEAAQYTPQPTHP
jgi:signal transduction histidine kinase